MKANFVAQFAQILKHWLCDVQSGIVMEKNRALSIDQCWLQALWFEVHLTDLLSMLLRYNDLTGIQKAVMDETPPNSDYDLFFGASSALGSSLELPVSPVTELVIAGWRIQSSFHHTSQSDREMVRC